MNEYIAKTFAGLEPLLAQELRDLGAENVQELTRAVAFEGDDALMYRANLRLRTCLRIIQPLLVEKTFNADQLYEAARSVNWMRFFTEKQTISVHSVVDKNPNFNNNLIVSLKVKDAIVDQFRDFKGSRPSVDKENPDIRIEVHMFKDRCTFSLDTSGESLHKRGYRRGGHAAPLNEIVAAALVMWSGWDKEKPLVDFMCGSGTILTEAALFGANIAPNLKRDKFGFQEWKNYDKKLYDKIWLEEKMNANYDADLRIIGSDIDPRAVEEARESVSLAGLEDFVRLSVADLFEKEPPKEAGCIITNPPYGERLQMRDERVLFEFYKRLGDQFKQRYKGWTAWVLGGNLDAMKHVGLRAARKYHVYNGSIECSFNKYEMY